MILAIASSGNTESSLVDQRFGRCSYFAIYDTTTQKLDFYKNPNKNEGHGAGPASVSFIAEKGANKAVSGEFGMKIKSIMNDLGIEMIVMKQEKTIQEIIDSI